MNKLAKVVASFGALALIAVPAMPVGAAEITVTPEDITAKLESANDGDTIKLLAGEYNASFTIDKKVTITSADPGEKAKITGTVTVAADGVNLNNLMFSGNNNNAIVLNEAENVSISDSSFEGTFSRAIVTGPSVTVDSLTISGNDFNKSTDHDIFIEGPGKNVVVKENELSNTVQLRGQDNESRLSDVSVTNNNFELTTSGGTTALMIMYVNNLTVNDNTSKVVDEGVPNGSAITLSGGIDGAVISKNNLTGSMDGISSWADKEFAAAGSTNDNIRIEDNTITGPERNGIGVAGGTNGVVISGNKISGGMHGINVYTSTKNVANSGIEVAGGNTISNASEAAIYISENAVTDKVKVVTNTNTFEGNKADIVVENNADLVEKVEEPVEIPGEPTEPEQGTETEPEAPTTDEGTDITAPNTGATVASAALVIVGAIVAVLTAVYAARFADARK